MNPYLVLFWIAVLALPVSYLRAQRIAEPAGVVSHIKLPSAPLPAEYTTYSISIHPKEELHRAGYSVASLTSKQFKLDGFQRVGSNGHFHIAITVEPFAILESEIKKKTDKRKDKEGNVTVSHTYEREITYYMPMTLYVEDYQGSVLLETVGGGVDQPIAFTYKKGKDNYVFNSTAKLHAAWRKDQVAKRLKKELVEKTMTAFSQQLRNKFATQLVQSRFYLEQPKGKKVAQVDLHATHTAAAIAALSRLGPETAAADIRQDLEAPIQFWTTEMKTYSPTDKKERKLYHACLYNLAVSHYWLDELDVAERLAKQLLAEVDWNKNRAEQLLSKIATTRQLFAVNEVDSRYFPIGDVPENAVGPEGADYSHLLPTEHAEEMVPVIDHAREVSGYVVVRGDSLQGLFRIGDAHLETPRFYVANNIIFYSEVAGQQVVIPVVADEIERMQMGKYRYTRTERGIKNDPSGKKHYAFLRYLEEGPQVSVLERFPTHREDNMSNPPTTYFIQKKGEKMISMDVTNVRWTNWKGAFAKYFADCPALEASVTAGDYKRNINHIRKAARLYNKGACQ